MFLGTADAWNSTKLDLAQSALAAELGLRPDRLHLEVGAGDAAVVEVSIFQGLVDEKTAEHAAGLLRTTYDRGELDSALATAGLSDVLSRAPIMHVEAELGSPSPPPLLPPELEADEVDSDTALTSSEALVGGALVAIIVAPIAAVLVIVAVIVAVVVCCCKKKKEEEASATGSADVASVEIKTSV